MAPKQTMTVIGFIIEFAGVLAVLHSQTGYGDRLMLSDELFAGMLAIAVGFVFMAVSYGRFYRANPKPASQQGPDLPPGSTSKSLVINVCMMLGIVFIIVAVSFTSASLMLLVDLYVQAGWLRDALQNPRAVCLAVGIALFLLGLYLKRRWGPYIHYIAPHRYPYSCDD